jgi:hypothetical protein
MLTTTPAPEHSKHRPVLTMCHFIIRLARHIAISSSLIAFSLGIGILGYHFTEHLKWIDAFANASMILSGMGPLNCPQSFGGKLFAGCYALYSGLVLILVAGIIFTPIVHRVLHRFHLEKQAT